MCRKDDRTETEKKLDSIGRDLGRTLEQPSAAASAAIKTVTLPVSIVKDVAKAFWPF